MSFQIACTGGRVILSFDLGREVVEQKHKKQFPDMVTYDLPDRIALTKAASEHSFLITEFLDEPTFYLAVLRFRSEETQLVDSS